MMCSSTGRPRRPRLQGGVGADSAVAFAALLDVPSPVRGNGDPLPPLWHWFTSGRASPATRPRRRRSPGGRSCSCPPSRPGADVRRRPAAGSGRADPRRRATRPAVAAWRASRSERALRRDGVRHRPGASWTVTGTPVGDEDRGSCTARGRRRGGAPGPLPRPAEDAPLSRLAVQTHHGPGAAVPVQRADLQRAPHPLRPALRHGVEGYPASSSTAAAGPARAGAAPDPLPWRAGALLRLPLGPACFRPGRHRSCWKQRCVGHRGRRDGS